MAGHYFRDVRPLFFIPVSGLEALVKDFIGFYTSSNGTTCVGLFITFWSHVTLFESSWTRARLFGTIFKASTMCVE